MTLVNYLGVSQDDIMEGHLWGEIVSRSLSSHGVAGLGGEKYYRNGYRQKTTHLNVLSCTKTKWSSHPQSSVLSNISSTSPQE